MKNKLNEHIYQNALDFFNSNSWPSKSDEEFKRASMNRYDFDSFKKLETSKISSKDFTDSNYDCGLVFVNGNLSEISKSSIGGVTLKSLSQLNENELSKFREGTLKHVKIQNKINAWHWINLEEGFYLDIDKNIEVKKPILLKWIDNRADGVSFPHVFINCSSSSKIEIVLDIESTDNNKNLLINSFKNLNIDKNSTVKIFDIEEINNQALTYSNFNLNIYRDATCHFVAAYFGASWHKSRIDVNALEKGVTAYIKGVYFAREDELKNLMVNQNHISPDGFSNSVFKGAVKDKANTVFQGLIHIHEGAKNSDAYLSNKNLILNDGARCDSIPMLEIANNEVKCSHGSTTSKISDVDLMYLQSRGISKSESRLLITLGLFKDILDIAPDFLQEKLNKLLEKSII